MAFLSRDALEGRGSRMSPVGESDDMKTPSSQMNMREKMMLQRQKVMAAKQRQITGGAGSMVLENQSAPVASVPTPMSGNPSSPARISQSMNTSLLSDVGDRDFDAENEDCDKSSLVMPVMTQEMKEEEARRRENLSQSLNNRGICPEFDPTGDGAPANRCAFDMSSIAPADMRSFLHHPFPKTAGMFQCRVVRERTSITSRFTPKYVIETDSGVFLMCAQKQAQNTTPNYAIAMSKGQMKKGSDSFLGKLRADVCGLSWVAYGPGLNPTKKDGKSKDLPALQNVRDEQLGVQYSSSFWGSKPKGPRKLSVTLPHVQPNGERLECRTLTPQKDGLLALADGQSKLIDSYCNKSPKWNDSIGAYILNFNKRVTEASVKNFQLVSTSDPDTVYLQFGKVGKDAFNIDFRYPFSPFQAFAMCLTAFDYKVGCE